MNRAIFNFNDKLDALIIRPLAVGYYWLTPQPVETALNHFFNNFGEVGRIFNHILQGQWKPAGNDTSRFLLNSTLGLVGFFDVARRAGLEKNDAEDFGQTLAVWGVGQGPYLVLPFFGPSTLRDSLGMPVGWFVDPLTYLDTQRVENSLKALEIIDTRSSFLKAEQMITGDQYTFIRDAYLQRRIYLINNGQIVDDLYAPDANDEIK